MYSTQVKVHTKHKRKKYLSLLAIMLMMSGGAVTAATNLNSTNNAVYAASKSKKSSKNKSKGKSDSTYNYASSWRSLGKKNVSASSKSGYLNAKKHDFDGYLIPAAKSKRKPMRMFGPQKGIYKITDAGGYLIDKNVAGNAAKGKVGAYYPNWYYYVDKDFKYKKKISVKVTLMNWRNPNGYQQYGIDTFHTSSVAASCQGVGGDEFKVEFVGLGKKRIPYSFWDIDDGQNISFGNDSFNNTKHFYHSPQTFVKYDKKSQSFEGGYSGLNLPASAGSVNSGDKRGAFTAAILGPAIDLTFSRGSVHYNLGRGKSGHHKSTNPSAPKKTYFPTKKRALAHYGIGHDDKGHASYGNYFGLTPSKRTPTPLITGSPLKNAAKYVGKNNFTSHYKDKDWKKSIRIDKPNSTFYYNIRNYIYAPAGTTDELGIDDFEVADTNIDKGLDIKAVHVYKQQYHNRKGDRVDKLFNISKAHGKVLVKLKDGAKRVNKPKKRGALGGTGKDDFFNGIFNVVITVKPNKKFSYPKREGNKFIGTARNRAKYITDYHKGGKDKWVSGGNTATATLTKGGKGHPVKDKPGVGQTTKDVFKKGNGTSGNSDFDLSHSWDKGTVAPGQWLKYRVWFNVPKLPSNTDTHKYKYTKGEITDKLDPNLDASSVTKAHVYFNGQRADATPGATVKGDLKPFLKQMRSGGKAMLEFEVKV